MVRVGLISDTHGLLRPEALAAMSGCDLIVHAGDIGAADILSRLGALAPVTAVRGNNDTADWAHAVPESAILAVGAVAVYVLHDRAGLKRRRDSAEFQVVVSGHSHKPSIETKDGVLYVNPGSAGPRRFRLPVSVAELQIAGSSVRARIIELSIQPRST